MPNTTNSASFYLRKLENNVDVGVREHSKIITLIHTSEDKAKVEGFIYVGSHNFTPAAWGTFAPGLFEHLKMAISNTEVGLLKKCSGTTREQIEREIDAFVSY